MRIIKSKLLKENKIYILENLKQAKQYLASNKISNEDFTNLVNSDPSPTKKYVGWMSKVWITEKPDIDDLRNTVEEYNVFLNKGKAKTKDINAFKSFAGLKNEVDTINKSGEGVSVKELEMDYETIIDNQDLLVMTPHTHEASRKLGLSHFAFRDCTDKNGKTTGEKDSAWCTTYKAPDHFNDYYHKHNVTFYYVLVKSPAMIEQLQKAFTGPHKKNKNLEKYKAMIVVALAVLSDGKIDGYDGLDDQLSRSAIKTFTQITGLK